MNRSTTSHPFISYLRSLADSEKRGALAALRRGLGQPPGTAPEMFRYVVPFLPTNASRAQENAHYLVAALFALHPKSTSEGNLGAHLAQTRNKEREDDALERRFTVLLGAHPDDLPAYLRQAISFLRSKDVPVNWEQLLIDVQAWEHSERRVIVQRNWARSFWGNLSTPETELSD